MSTLNFKSINWNPVELNSQILESGIDGLIGIEECTDYNLIRNPSGKKKGKKRKLKQLPPESDDIKSKRKKKKKIEKACDLTENCDMTPSKTGSTAASGESNESEMAVSKIFEGAKAWSNYGLPESILKAIIELNFIQPTEIQALTLPAAILGRRDILGAAETGSGKTLAFGLPILAGILKIKDKISSTFVTKNKSTIEGNSGNDSESDEEEEVINLAANGIGCVKAINNVELASADRRPLYALILTPTRELAMQVKSHLMQVARYTGIHVAVVVGGMAEVKQERILKKGPEIVVATPGRLWELIQSGNPHLKQVDDISFFAIDETDRMLERGHFQELHGLLERINMNEYKKKHRQNFVFSATLTLVHQLPKYLLTKKKVSHSKKIKEISSSQKLQKIVEMLGITNPKIVDITEGSGTSGTLTESRITCAHDEKDYYVYYFLLKHPGRTLIFCNSIGCVKRLTTLLSLLNCKPLPLHASMQQKQRLKNLERFKDNDNAILIATDVAARGLDIPSVQHVLHYQTPRTSESYVHRSGRTARAFKEGITVLLIEPTELTNYLNLCRTLGKSEDLPIFPVQDNYLDAVKQRVHLARDLDKLQLQVRKANAESGWFQKAAKDMDMIIDDEAMKYDAEDTNQAKRHADIKRKELNMLLSKDIIPKGVNSKFPLSTGPIDMFVEGESKGVTAIDVLKNTIDLPKKAKKKNLQLYKPKKSLSNKQVSEVPVKSKNNNRDKRKRFFKRK